jgi:Phytanoyl-CoA dioxygenase (PhyH)
MTKDETILPPSTEMGTTGIYHLKRLWAKAMLPTLAEQPCPEEWQLDNALLDLLGTALLPTFSHLHSDRPSFAEFEQWVANHYGGVVPSALVQQCNALVAGVSTAGYAATDDVLSPADLAFWETHGYVVVRNAVSAEDCAAARNAIWQYLEMDENDPASWYRPNNVLQGIMAPLYRHPALDKNRYSPIIRRAYEQLWGHSNLLVTTDKVGFNPPETEHHKYKGIGLHWDVSLVPPVPFGVQGILYLTDTAANQGAFTLVPGFHRRINDWLGQLPAGTDPRKVDLAPFGPQPIAAHAGDFIIWHHALPHGASPNRANSPRLVQYLYWYPAQRELQSQWA